MNKTLSVWILGDPLLDRHPALAVAEEAVGRDNVRVVLVESAARARRLPYQRKKLVLPLSNFCLLTGVEPMAVNDWFLAAFVDAYEWVMLPNLLGMGLNGDGGRTATKPYVASANYIHKMSDYCAGCRYDRKARTGPDACPFNFLYWNFLLAHEQTLLRNPRLGNAVLGLRHLDQDERARVREQAAAFLAEIDGP